MFPVVAELPDFVVAEDDELVVDDDEEGILDGLCVAVVARQENK